MAATLSAAVATDPNTPRTTATMSADSAIERAVAMTQFSGWAPPSKRYACTSDALSGRTGTIEGRRVLPESYHQFQKTRRRGFAATSDGRHPDTTDEGQIADRHGDAPAEQSHVTA